MSNPAKPGAAVSGGSARSIAWPIFALVIASVIGATVVLFVVTFSGPPPIDPPRSIERMAMVLRHADELAKPDRFARRSTAPGASFVGFRNRDRRREMYIGVTAAPPAPGVDERPNPRRAARIAEILDTPAADVVAYEGFQPSVLGDNDVMSPFTFGWRTNGHWHVVHSLKRPFFSRWHIATLLAMLGVILALSIPAWALARAISRPLRRLAHAADQSRAGAALGPLPTGGSREVRHLTNAISTMHARLLAHAEGRTTMLGAIAHDLGTPLSRLAFWVEQLPEAARTRASADIDEMRAMIAATLVFARDEGGELHTTRVDLGSLLDSLVEDMHVSGAPVTIAPGARAIVRGDSGALRRLFANLVENAIRYGDRADVSWSVGAGSVEVKVADAGQGIDPSHVERLFEPFVRGDPSRNRSTGGTGLGLAIVRSIAARHRGDVVLENGPTGAVARVTLPLSA